MALQFSLTSSAFEHNRSISKIYTCDGKNISPSIRWENAPAGTKSFVLICDDPDAPGGTWDHWVLFNIPAQVTHFDEGIVILPSGTVEGINSWKKKGYGGPCPPTGEHRYFFTLYALDVILNLSEGATKQEVLTAAEGHVLAKTSMIGLYKRG